MCNFKTELLAPAKNIEVGKAAIDAGADAVYIGAGDFGARKNACNSIGDIKELVNYAHKFRVKVMVTVNTIIKDSELDSVKSLIKELYEAGVDSLIVQDMAIIKWAIEGQIPPIPLHISTQCDNRISEKVNFFNKIGLSRVVLARELSLEQIENIISQNPGIEIETFVHGALCVSYSGQCYLSQYIGGRSANRGECAQPCRKKYTLIDSDGNIIIKDKHLLCLKDFCVGDNLKKMVNIGVKSFKIEGRLKDINYVKNIVSYYRKQLDKYSTKTSSGSVDFGFEPNIYKTFNRGYTTYFLNGRENCFNFDSPKFIGEEIGTVSEIKPKYFKIKLKDGIILSPQDGLVFSSTGEKGCLINKIENDCIYPNTMPEIKKGEKVFRNSDILFEKSLKTSKTKRRIGVSITFEKGIITATDEDGEFIEYKIAESEPANNKEKIESNFIESFKKTGDTDFRTEAIEIKSELPFIPISKINHYRREIFERLMDKKLSNYKRELQKPLNYTNYFIDTLDYRGNVYNKESLEFYKKCGVFVKEFALEANVPKGEIELMRTKHCIKYALDMCKSPKELYLTDDMGDRFKLKFDCKNCEMAVLKTDN